MVLISRSPRQKLSNGFHTTTEKTPTEHLMMKTMSFKKKQQVDLELLIIFVKLVNSCV